MRLYRCDFYDQGYGGVVVTWHGNKADANRDLRDKRKDRRKRFGSDAAGPETVTPVEVPTDRKGLIAWLNANLDTDNG